jgi:hypothetical protein
MDRAAFVRLFRDPLVDTFEIFLKNPSETSSAAADPAEVWREIRPVVLTSTDFKAEGMRIIDDFFKLLDSTQFVTF